MFTNTNCLALTSYAWDTAPQTVLFAKLCGFKVDGRRLWPRTILGGREVHATYLSVTLREWLRDAWKDFADRGEFFLGSVYAELGLKLPPNPDTNHSGVFGIALSMIAGGQPAKAAMTFNEWAAITNFDKIDWLGRRGNVDVLRIGKLAIVEIRPGLVVRVVTGLAET